MESGAVNQGSFRYRDGGRVPGNLEVIGSAASPLSRPDVEVES
jgi:hypothetical protein